MNWQLTGDINEFPPFPEVGDGGLMTVGDRHFSVQVAAVRSLDFGARLTLNVQLPLTDPMPLLTPGMDGPACVNCGGMTKRTGTCATCTSCGETTGCG